MMHPESMERVTIVAPQKHFKQTIELLYNYNVLHIVDHAKGKLDIGSPLPGSAQIAELLVKARSVIHSLSIDRETTAPTTVLGDLGQQITTAHDQVTKLLTEYKELEEDMQKLTADKKAYESFRWVKINAVKLRQSKHLSYFFGTVKDPKEIEHNIAKLTHKFYFEHEHNGTGILLLIEKEKTEQARELLQTQGFQPLDHAKLVELTRPVEQQIKNLDNEIKAVAATMHDNKEKQQHVAKEFGSLLVSAEKLLSVEAKKAQAPLRFGVSKNVFFINGWVPTKNRAALHRELEEQLGNEVHVQLSRSHENAPIKLNNSFAVSPFEALLRLYTLPSYHEIDPSTFLFLSFPIFFGFMLGDIGYGLVLLAIFMLMHALFKENREVKALASILIMSSVASVIFGIIFGEFFGAEEIGHFHLHPIIHRAEDMTTLLAVAVAVGVIHITIALIIGFVNELHHHGAWKAFCAKISWILLLAAVGLLGAGYTMHIPTIAAGYALAILSIILIYIGEGVKGLIEIPGIFSNIMSYARLMALGVASAALAIVINELAGQMFHTGTIVGIIGGIVILVVGHAINIVLGIIGPFLHSLRLHYVEFFSKFYQGGGKPYKPFGVDET